MNLSFDFNHLLNEKPLYFLRKRMSGKVPFALPSEVKDAYQGQGSHPDIVARLWDELGKALPVDGRCLIFGTPALIHGETGVLLGICGGTSYFLRLSPDQRKEAKSKGAQTLVKSSLGDIFDVTKEIGSDWVCANWDKREMEWLKENYKALLKHVKTHLNP